MRRRNKKSKTVSKNTQTPRRKKNYELEQLPLDLVIEIIVRLPVKSVARFLAVSKLWAAIIRSGDFIRRFPFGLSSQPRILIACSDLHVSRELTQDWYMFSSSSSSSTTSLLSRVTCPFPYASPYDHVMLNQCSFHHVNGLISLAYGPKQIVANPSTGTSITLPNVKTRRRTVKNFFGYDQVKDQYKVLCMTEEFYGHHNNQSCEHQVFTLGASKSWRMIDCSTHHRPWTNGVCIDSVVYYVAKTGEAMSHQCLMRFDLRSESLELCSGLPTEMQTPDDNVETLIIYEGKVAKPIQTSLDTFDVWIIDQNSDKRDWLKKISFSIQPYYYVSVIGTSHTGEFILAPSYCSCDQFYVVHYNPDMNNVRKIKFKLSDDYYKFRSSCFRTFMVFSDYVESVRLL